VDKDLEGGGRCLFLVTVSVSDEKVRTGRYPAEFRIGYHSNANPEYYHEIFHLENTAHGFICALRLILLG